MTKTTQISEERMADIRREWAAEDPAAAAAQWERLREAKSENSLSGALRRAVHAGHRTVNQLAQDVGIDSWHLSEWLEGERTLRSDVLDRIALILGASVTISLPPREPRPENAAHAQKT